MKTLIAHVDQFSNEVGEVNRTYLLICTLIFFSFTLWVVGKVVKDSKEDDEFIKGINKKEPR